MGGSTFTAEALNKTLKDFEASDSLESTSTARVIILLTDGRLIYICYNFYILGLNYN